MTMLFLCGLCVFARAIPTFGCSSAVRPLVVSLDSIDPDSERRPESRTRSHELEPAAAGEGARRRSHGLECDIVFVLRCEDLRVAVALKQIHSDSASRSRD